MIDSMKVYRGIDALPPFINPVVTIGTFDGVHAGHRVIIERIRKRAAEINGQSILITFEPHPRLVLGTQTSPLNLLTTLDEKIELLQQLGIDFLVVVPFTKEFASMSADDYIEDFLINHFHPHTFVIGYDHHFGNHRSGNFKMLEQVKDKFGFQLEEIPVEEIEQVAVSSTKIRQALSAGKIQIANEYLCAPYRLQGNVVHGDKRGRLIGFPTANLIAEDPHKLIPAVGVYAVRATVQQKTFKGMMNIGFRPTVHEQGNLSLEVHLFDFNESIYDTMMDVFFIDRIRDEQKFDNIEMLVKQLYQDKQDAVALLTD